ncbi:hypothetical protein AMECASPLE_037995 [Ameca splendens]|uniref:Uncharacterized protein n=1 Tax=Ameca splendens TaxID=208324 RepID=A0ABV0YJ67_9TELE
MHVDILGKDHHLKHAKKINKSSDYKFYCTTKPSPTVELLIVSCIRDLLLILCLTLFSSPFPPKSCNFHTQLHTVFFFLFEAKKVGHCSESRKASSPISSSERQTVKRVFLYACLAA